MTISTPEPPQPDVLNTYIADAIQLCNDGAEKGHKAFFEAGFLAIHCLASYANRDLYKSATPSALGRGVEQCRMEYQAAIFSQRLKDAKEGKDQRRLILYSVRLHMLLGLATLGFELYRHARIKEMLTDTLSHHLLTGIALIHPFETNGVPQVSPDEELAGVIGKSEKMEKTMNEYLSSNSPKDYPYDSVIDMLSFKNALRSSLTKHICVVQRRRIARLKGEQPAESLNLDLRSK
jgi:N-terminal acetyltransferase B complex non-catalytic subunit